MSKAQRSSLFMRFPFRGLMAPVFTPFDKDQNLNLPVIQKYAEYLHSAGISGVLVNGTCGEGTSLTTEERRLVLETWLQEGLNYSISVMVQVGGTNMKDVKSLAKHAEKCRVNAILCLPDLFFRPETVDELIYYLQLISAEAPHTPLLYYHVPCFTGVKLNVRELLERSSEVPTLVGLKFTDNDLVLGGSCVTESLKQHPVFLGCDSLLLSALLLGFDSAISTTINIFPALNKQILKYGKRYFNEKDYERAAKTQLNLNSLVRKIAEQGTAISTGPWVSSMKAAMRKIAQIDVGPVRDPLVNVEIEKL